ncbi:acylhydrolase [Comamonas phosphati]|nr:acylhydrolase [Comamonas phosphati]
MRQRITKIGMASAVLAAVTACGGGGDDRTPVKSITVFGDSLSDVGTYHAATGDAANPGKFTVNPGNVWVENVAAHYGLAVTPNRSLTLDKDASSGATAEVGTATVIGGNGYAEGGARVAMLPSESGIGNNQLVAPVRAQVNRYLQTHDKFPDDGLVLISGGGNDIYAQFSAVCWHTDDNNLGAGNTTLDIATAKIAEAAQAEVDMIRQIRSKGARLIVLISQGNPIASPFWRHYTSPEYQAKGCYTPVTAQQTDAWRAQFNTIVQEAVANMPEVVYVDAQATWGNVQANPARYGFTNLTDKACTNTKLTTSATFCTRATMATPDADQTYFWSDSFHPTPRGHQVLSDQVLELLKSRTR